MLSQIVEAIGEWASKCAGVLFEDYDVEELLAQREVFFQFDDIGRIGKEVGKREAE